MMNYHKLIKTMSNSDNLTLFMEKDDPNHMGIKIENGEKNTITIYKLNLMDLSEESISIPPATFASVITMPSGDFQKICRDMHNLADLIEIKSVGSQLIFNCHGDFASQETVIGESSNNGMSFVKRQEKEEIVQGVFALKHLCLFTKCTNLCNTIEMYLKNDYPLIICYSVANLGQIKLCLAPQCQNENTSVIQIDVMQLSRKPLIWCDSCEGCDGCDGCDGCVFLCVEVINLILTWGVAFRRHK